MLELWGRANAYNVQKPLWLLEELDLEFTHYDVGSNAGDLETAEFLALNPHARVPVLRDGDAVVWESHTVLRYLANRFNALDIYPEDPLQRSQVERWMDWGHTSLQPVFMDLFWGYYRTPPESRKQSAIDAAQQRCAQHFELLDRHLAQQPYLAGESFTMADIPCAVCLYRYFQMGLAVDQPGHVMQWYQRLSQRSAFANTIMTSFDELKGRINY